MATTFKRRSNSPVRWPANGATQNSSHSTSSSSAAPPLLRWSFSVSAQTGRCIRPNRDGLVDLRRRGRAQCPQSVDRDHGVTAVANAATANSSRQRKLVEAPANSEIADGLACRRPNQDALDIIFAHVPRIVEVSEAEIADAMSIYHQDTHNISEGAGAAALAAALKEKSSLHGKRAGIILTGGNVDRELYVAALTGTFQTGASQTSAVQNRPFQSEALQPARPA